MSWGSVLTPPSRRAERRRSPSSEAGIIFEPPSFDIRGLANQVNDIDNGNQRLLQRMLRFGQIRPTVMASGGQAFGPHVSCLLQPVDRCRERQVRICLGDSTASAAAIRILTYAVHLDKLQPFDGPEYLPWRVIHSVHTPVDLLGGLGVG